LVVVHGNEREGSDLPRGWWLLVSH
jgi:hypothetical protein